MASNPLNGNVLNFLFCFVLFCFFVLNLNILNVKGLYSSADMCLNCSLSVKSTKIGMMTVFKALKKIGYGAIAKTTVKGHLKGSLKTAAILNRK